MDPIEQPVEQAPEASLDERIANILGGPQTQEQPEQTQAASEETAEETFELELEGAKYILPKKLEKGFMQERDYTQKAQTLAEQRKDYDRQLTQIRLSQAEGKFNESVAQDNQQLSMIEAVLGEYKNLNWAQMSTDEMYRKRMEMDQYKDARETLKTGLSEKRQQFDRAYQQELTKLKADAAESVKRRISGWSPEVDAEVRSYALEKGITEAEYDGVFDPRHKEILWAAAQYNKLKASAQPVAQQLKSVKTNPSNPMPQKVKEQLSFRKAIQATANDPAARRQTVESRVEQLFRK